MMSEDNSGGNDSVSRQDNGLHIGLANKTTPSKRFTHKFSRSTRRGVLKLFSAMGASGALTKGLSKAALAKESRDPTKQVPYTEKFRANDVEKLGTESPTELQAKAGSMPHDKWKEIEAAKKASIKLSENLSEMGYSNISVGISTENRRNGKQKTVVVNHQSIKGNESQGPPKDILKNKIPDHAKVSVGKQKYQERFNLPIKVKSTELELTAFDDKVRPITGGVKIEAYYPEGPYCSSDAAVAGTTAQPVYNSSDSSYSILTAGHVLAKENWSCSRPTADSTSQPEIGDGGGGIVNIKENNLTKKIRDINDDGDDDKYWLATKDYGTFFSDGEYKIEGNSNVDELNIVGYVSQYGLSYAEDKDKTYYQQGVNSGRNSCNITYVDFTNDWFATNTLGRKGDSGGPFFKREDNDAFTAGVISSKVDYDNDDWFVEMYEGASGNTIEGIVGDDDRLRFSK